MSNIKIVQSCRNFAQLSKILKTASSKNLRSLTQKTKICPKMYLPKGLEDFKEMPILYLALEMLLILRFCDKRVHSKGRHLK